MIKCASASSFKAVFLCVMKQLFVQTLALGVPTFKVSILKYRFSTPFSVLDNVELFTLNRKDLKCIYT